MPGSRFGRLPRKRIVGVEAMESQEIQSAMRAFAKVCSGALTITFLLGPAGALADSGVYLGVGVSASDARSFPSAAAPSGSDSSGTLGGLSVTLGNRFETGGAFYGVEANADFSLTGHLENGGLSCSDGVASSLYFCDHTATVRLRGLAGTGVGKSDYEVFGTVGYAAMVGEGAIDTTGLTDTGAVSGFTFGFGIQREIIGGRLRAEVVRDRLETSLTKPGGTATPTWEATSVIFSYVMDF